MIEKAKLLAYNKHNEPAPAQRYGNQPYSVHLDAVVNNAKKYIHHISEEDRNIVISACYCHDLIEDSELSASDIEKILNHDVADMVFRVSNERGWGRKEKNFKTYPKIWVNDLAIFIKLMDRIANTRNSKESGHGMYEIYHKEYPVFRYALKCRNLYEDAWKELDDLNDYYGIIDKNKLYEK